MGTPSSFSSGRVLAGPGLGVLRMTTVILRILGVCGWGVVGPVHILPILFSSSYPNDVSFSFYYKTRAAASSVRPSTFSSLGNLYSQHNQAKNIRILTNAH